MVGPRNDAPGESEGRFVARGLGPLVGMNEPTRHARTFEGQRGIESVGERRGSRSVANHERDARAKAAALIERDHVRRQRGRRVLQRRVARDERDPHPGTMTTHADALSHA